MNQSVPTAMTMARAITTTAYAAICAPTHQPDQPSRPADQQRRFEAYQPHRGPTTLAYESSPRHPRSPATTVRAVVNVCPSVYMHARLAVPPVDRCWTATKTLRSTFSGLGGPSGANVGGCTERCLRSPALEGWGAGHGRVSDPDCRLLLMHLTLDGGSIALGGLTGHTWVALEDDPGSGYTGCISQGRVRRPERQCCEGLR